MVARCMISESALLCCHAQKSGRMHDNEPDMDSKGKAVEVGGGKREEGGRRKERRRSLIEGIQSCSFWVSVTAVGFSRVYICICIRVYCIVIFFLFSLHANQ